MIKNNTELLRLKDKSGGGMAAIQTQRVTYFESLNTGSNPVLTAKTINKITGKKEIGQSVTHD